MHYCHSMVSCSLDNLRCRDICCRKEATFIQEDTVKLWLQGTADKFECVVFSLTLFG